MRVSVPFGRTLLAFGLCVLAFSFAMEAKLAWYGPDSGPGVTVSAAKALPADIPCLVSHGVPVPDPIHPLIPFVLLVLSAASCLPSNLRLKLLQRHNHRPAFSAFCFSPHSFFRPPPAN
jgi:hypothetical protein